jgi:AcrR family transcriptional regulator
VGLKRVVLSRELLASAAGGRWDPAQIDRAAEVLAEGGGRLRSGGRTGLPDELVKLIQRERILIAMLRAVAELGYRDTSVQDVLDRSGVSRPTFYEYFGNKDECFIAAFEEAGGRLRNRVETAAGDGGKDWRDRLRAGLAELLQFIADEPDAARVLIVAARVAGPATVQRHDQLLDYFAGWIDGEARAGVGEPPSPVAAAGIVGGIETLLYSRINQGETELQSLLPSLMYFAVLPYAGRRAATAELRKTAAD